MNAVQGEAMIDVFFIGVGKCGTSWIYKYLTKRGDAGVPSIKEPYVLNNPPEKHAEVIADLYGSQRPRCDFSNVYYWDPTIPKKIIEHNPDAKVVLTVRKPSQRVSSHFGFLQRNGEYVGMDLVEYLNSGDPDQLVARSDYQSILDRVAAVTSQENILVMPLELLSANPQRYADRLADFLDLARREIDESDRERVLGRASARIPVVNRAAKGLATAMRERGYLKLLSKLKESERVRSLLFTRNNEGGSDLDASQLPTPLKALDEAYPDFLEKNRAAV